MFEVSKALKEEGRKVFIGARDRKVIESSP